jgi:hypothetical protein|tara:strand:- start:1700 stop:1999 length:300 start_codon:yes stop_codon:yes gene_type:complete
MEEIMSEELLEESVISLVDICNNIYRHVDRSERKEMSKADVALVETYNLLVDINQKNLDILYPKRLKERKPIRHLALRHKRIGDNLIIDEVSKEVLNEY